ncbi:MAG TPA: hypothetical protein VIQ31_11665 [Phormidium sp.]
MSRKGLNSTQQVFVFLITAIVFMVFAIRPFYLAVALPGLHGALVAESALSYYKEAHSSKRSLIAELICSGLLVLGVLLGLIVRSLFGFYCGLILAAIATFILTIIGIIEVIKAFRSKRYQRRNIVRLLLNSSALLIYCSLVFSLTFLVVLGLAGESYMGN